jgi:DNA-binding cell septation regulator SpoVG
MSEPRFGYCNLVKAKKEGRIKAYFTLLVPTESIGTMHLLDWKIIEGKSGYFVSSPNKAVPIRARRIVNVDTGETTNESDGVKYFNTIRFESYEKYKEFNDELNKNLLPVMLEQLAK